MQRDQLRNTGGALAAFDLNDEAIVGAQPVGWHVLRFGDDRASPQPGTGRDRQKVADAVRTIVQRVLQSLEAHDGSNEHGRQAEREKSVSNGLAAWQRMFRAVMVDVDPLLVAGCIRKLV